MNLYEKFSSDMITAMKEKNKEKLTVIRMVKGAMQLEHINNKKELNEDLLIDVVSKQIKMRNDSIEEFKKGDRQDLITATQSEIEILKEYLPEQLTEEEVDNIIDEVIKEVNPTSGKDMGIIMKNVSAKVKGKADMKVVSAKIRERLANI